MSGGYSIDTTAELLEHAKHTLGEPWAHSEEDKLRALRFLGSVASTEAIGLIVKGLELVEIPTRSSEHATNDHIPGGHVSNLAARLLAKHPCPEGLQYVISVLVDDKLHPLLRIIAAKSLGEIRKPEVYRALISTLMDCDQELQQQIVLAIREILERTCDHSAPHVADLIMGLVDFTLEVADQEPPPPALKLVRQLLSRYQSTSTEEYLIEVLLRSNDPAHCCMAVELLGEYGSELAHRALTLCLLRRNRDPNVYVLIGKILKFIKKPFVVKAAVEVLEERNWLRMFLAFVLPYRSAALKARRSAAIGILDRKDSLEFPVHAVPNRVKVA